MDYHALRERDIERLADLVEQHLDTALLRHCVGSRHAPTDPRRRPLRQKPPGRKLAGDSGLP
jgi:hypothetical protein